MPSKFGKSIAEARPELIAEWHPTKNAETPFTVKPGSSRKFWWVCAEGHEWEAPADNRVYNRAGCPSCRSVGGRVLMPGVNDLESRFPELVKEWHPTKNTKSPRDVFPGTRERAWWVCSICDREWNSMIKTRTGKGSGCRNCANRIRGSKGHTYPRWLEKEYSTKNRLSLSDYTSGSRERVWWECNKGHVWQAAIGDRVAKSTRCKQCGSGGTSRREADLRGFVEGLGAVVRAHHRQIDSRYEYDITVPGVSLAIEFNGLYWHSEQKKGAYYHLNKSAAAQGAGYQLIHVWEDDWVNRRGVVELMLARKLGLSQERKLNARSLNYRQVGSPDAQSFLESYHIQGRTGGSWRGGLYDGDTLVALMLMRKRSGGVWELTRFATSAIVRGGFSRLLKRALEELKPSSVVTFSDTGVSGGGLYASAGFVRDGVLAPDYMYVVNGKREHKFNYRKKRFRDDPGLKFTEGLTERELAELNGLDRIYDAGKVRWVLTPD